MNKLLYFGLVIGAAVAGAAVAIYYTKDTERKRADEEIAQMREYYAQKEEKTGKTSTETENKNTKFQEIWKREAKQWETASIRLQDELRSATRMAQYWRARCMNAHCDFTAACDGEGHYPTDNDVPTREEKLVSDIMDAVAVVDKKDEAIPA